MSERADLKMKSKIRLFWLWIKKLFHRPRTEVVPFKKRDTPHFARHGRSSSPIVRAGRSMRRGRLLGV